MTTAKKILIVLAILAILIGIGGFVAFKIFMGGLEGKGIGGKIFKKAETLIKEKVAEYEQKAPLTEEKKEETNKEEAKPEEPIIKSTGKMNDDILVEIGAYGWYYFWLGGKNPIAAQKLWEELESGKIHKKFGVTKEEFEAYGENLSEKDPARYVNLMTQMQERAEEKWGIDLSE